MKQDQLSLVGGALQGMYLPTSGSDKQGSLHVTDRFLVVQGKDGPQQIEVMDGNDFIEWISFLGRAQSNNRLLNVVNNAAATFAVGNTNPKVNPYHTVNSNSQPSGTLIGLNTTLTTNDFTVEGWRRINSLAGDPSYPHDIFTANRNLRIGWRYGVGQFWVQFLGVDTNITLSPVVDQWHHIAFEREGTTARFYYNGELKAEWTAALTSLGITSMIFGTQYGLNMPTTNLDEIVLTRIAKYKGQNFIPKSTPINLTP